MDKFIILKDVRDYVKRHYLLNKTQKKVQVSTTSEGYVVYVDKKPKVFTVPIITLAYSFREAVK
jgi:hypothetical protein